jgi:hypothetical protein
MNPRRRARMHGRARTIAAVAAGTVALGAVSTAAAVASTTDGKPGAHSKTASPSGKPRVI